MAGLITAVFAKTKHATNQYSNNGVDKDELNKLSDELSKLRSELKRQSSTREHDIDIAAIAEAEQAAISGKEDEVASWLSKTGQWTLDVATKIGVSVASAAIKKAIGA
ncbi:MAG: hypothetical protein AAGG02_10710 [Cyanobacteria bacterium P01_H01_bin.15]